MLLSMICMSIHFTGAYFSTCLVDSLLLDGGASGASLDGGASGAQLNILAGGGGMGVP